MALKNLTKEIGYEYKVKPEPLARLITLKSGNLTPRGGKKAQRACRAAVRSWGPKGHDLEPIFLMNSSFFDQKWSFREVQKWSKMTKNRVFGGYPKSTLFQIPQKWPKMVKKGVKKGGSGGGQNWSFFYLVFSQKKPLWRKKRCVKKPAGVGTTGLPAFRVTVFWCCGR